MEIKLGSPAIGIAIKTVHKTLPAGGGGRVSTVVGVGGLEVVEWGSRGWGSRGCGGYPLDPLPTTLLEAHSKAKQLGVVSFKVSNTTNEAAKVLATGLSNGMKTPCPISLHP